MTLWRFSELPEMLPCLGTGTRVTLQDGYTIFSIYPIVVLVSTTTHNSFGIVLTHRPRSGGKPGGHGGVLEVAVDDVEGAT